MEVFPLAGLDRHLLEKIITKMEGNSYFRLQQTCRGMKEFIQKIPNISVSLDGRLDVDCNENGMFWMYSPFKSKEKKPVGVEHLCGIRFKCSFVHLDAKVCGDLCYILKKNRITCTKLFFLSTSQWTIELCVKLLDILKPVEVDLDSEGSNRYEALFQSKTVEQIRVTLDLDILNKSMEKFLSTFLTVDLELSYQNTKPFDVIRIALQILFFKPLPNLRSFNLDIWEHRGLPSLVVFKKQFRDVTLVNTRREDHVFISASVKLPQYFPQGSWCKVGVEDCGGYTNWWIVFRDRE